MREIIYELKILRNGDLIVFDAIPSPNSIIGRQMQTCKLVDVTGLEFLNASPNPKKVMDKELRAAYENIAFICEFRNNRLKILSAHGLLGLILDEKYKKIFTDFLQKHYKYLS